LRPKRWREKSERKKEVYDLQLEQGARGRKSLQGKRGQRRDNVSRAELSFAGPKKLFGKIDLDAGKKTTPVTPVAPVRKEEAVPVKEPVKAPEKVVRKRIRKLFPRNQIEGVKGGYLIIRKNQSPHRAKIPKGKKERNTQVKEEPKVKRNWLQR